MSEPIEEPESENNEPLASDDIELLADMSEQWLNLSAVFVRMSPEDTSNLRELIKRARIRAEIMRDNE